MLHSRRWPVRAVERYGGPWNHTLKNPIIVIGNKADPVTPIAAARLVAEMLGHSAVFLEHEGYGVSPFHPYLVCVEITHLWVSSPSIDMTTSTQISIHRLESTPIVRLVSSRGS